MTIGFLAQGVGHYIGFTMMVMNFQVIVLDQLQPSSLPYVQVNLGEDVQLLWSL
jgi:hypothetical protein